MSFIPKDWRNLPDETTPLSAEALENMEVRLSDYSDDAAQAGLSTLTADVATLKNSPVNVLRYGADPTGATSSVAAFADAVAACISSTDPVTTARYAHRALYIPGGYYMTNTTALLSLTSVIGLRVLTDGPYTTIFRADASMESIVDLNGIAHCHFDGFTCQSKSSGNDASVVVQKPFKMYWDNTTAARSTTDNRFEAIVVSDCRFVRGTQIGLDGSGLQCDSTQIDRCVVVGQAGFGYGDVANTTSTLLNCSVTAMAIGHEIYGYGIQAGTTITNIVGSTITLSLPATASLTRSFIFSTAPGLWQRGINVGSGVAGNNYGHHITLAQGGNVRYGLYVANTSGVIEQWDGLTNQTDFFFAGVGDGCFAIKSGRGEGSQRMMDTTGASSLSNNIEISDMIWFGNRMHGDRGWVKYFSGGSVSLNRVKCYGLDATQPITPAIVITPNAVTRQMSHLTLAGCSMQAPLVTLLNQMDMQRTNVNVTGYSEISSGLTPVLHTPTYQSHPSMRRQTIATDANFTITPGSSPTHTLHTGTLTAVRTVTISTTGAFDGMEFEFTRTGGGAFNLNIGGLTNLAKNQWCRIAYNGTTSAWYLSRFGNLLDDIAVIREAPLNVMDSQFGAVGDGTTDDYAAINAAIAAVPLSGGQVLLPRVHKINTGLAWTGKPVHLLGGVSSNALPFGAPVGSALIAAAGITAISFEQGSSGQGSRSIVENLHIYGSDSGVGGNNGIRLRANGGAIIGCKIEKFAGNGIHILSGVDGTPFVVDGAHNANAWYIERTRCANNYTNGLFVEGVDSNAGVASMLDCSGNAAAGVYDNSAFGNTYVGLHIDGNTTVGIHLGTQTQGCRFHGVYKEGDGLPAVLIDAGAGQNFIDFRVLVNPATETVTDNSGTGENVIVYANSVMRQSRLIVGNSANTQRVNVDPTGILFGTGSDVSLSRGASGHLQVGNAIMFSTAITAASAQNNTLFRDSADNKLKFKDSSGTTNILY